MIKVSMLNRQLNIQLEFRSKVKANEGVGVGDTA